VSEQFIELASEAHAYSSREYVIKPHVKPLENDAQLTDRQTDGEDAQCGLQDGRMKKNSRHI